MSTKSKPNRTSVDRQYGDIGRRAYRPKMFPGVQKWRKLKCRRLQERILVTMYQASKNVIPAEVACGVFESYEKDAKWQIYWLDKLRGTGPGSKMARSSDRVAARKLAKLFEQIHTTVRHQPKTQRVAYLVYQQLMDSFLDEVRS